MEQAGHVRIMRRPTAAPKFIFQNSDQIESVKPLCDQKDVISNCNMGEKAVLVFARESSPES